MLLLDVTIRNYNETGITICRDSYCECCTCHLDFSEKAININVLHCKNYVLKININLRWLNELPLVFMGSTLIEI